MSIENNTTGYESNDDIVNSVLNDAFGATDQPQSDNNAQTSAQPPAQGEDQTAIDPQHVANNQQQVSPGTATYAQPQVQPNTYGQNPQAQVNPGRVKDDGQGNLVDEQGHLVASRGLERRLWNEAQAAVGEFTRAKQAAEQDARGVVEQAPRVDPSVQRNAAEWMRRNSWYRPDTSDRDSQIAKKVDELLVTEGMNPSDPDYWDELDNRLQKALPHRYNDTSDGNSAVRKPRNVVGSSGREASAAFGGNNRTQFVLSPERVKAMKEVGAWDNPTRKKAMIENFIKYDRANGNR